MDKKTKKREVSKKINGDYLSIPDNSDFDFNSDIDFIVEIYAIKKGKDKIAKIQSIKTTYGKLAK